MGVAVVGTTKSITAASKSSERLSIFTTQKTNTKWYYNRVPETTSATTTNNGSTVTNSNNSATRCSTSNSGNGNGEENNEELLLTRRRREIHDLDNQNTQPNKDGIQSQCVMEMVYFPTTIENES